MNSFPTRPKVLLVVPCYNEAERLPAEEFRRHLAADPALHFVFVDDGSADETARVLTSVGSGFERRATVLSYPENRGKAEAVRHGIQYALAHLEPEIVGFWDADLATPLEELAAFISVLENRPEIDLVFGARVKLLGRQISRLPLRHYLGRVFATVASQVLGLPVYDTQCGAKLFRVTPHLHSIFDEAFLSQWIFDVEILARFQRLYGHDEHRLGRSIYEYPLQKWTDVAGSKVKPRHFFVALADLVRIQLRTRRRVSQGALGSEPPVKVKAG